jgi:hypothetical protein
MAIARCVSTLRSKVFLGAMGFTVCFAMVSLSAAQTALPPTDELRANMDSASLPDAPTPTATVLSADNLPSPAMAFFSADLEPQASQTALITRTQNPQQNPQQAPQQTPSSSAPSLGDLGLTPEQTKPDPDTQARLDRRTHMLKVHQELGLYTVIPIVAACISGAGATPSKNNYTSTTSRDVHVAIAGVGIGMYAATAYYAIRAPRVADGPARGGIKIHKYLIWIHAPGMILTPILGTMAFNDIANGHKPSGIEQYHSAVALTTAIAYGASIIAVSWPIHLKF